LIKKQAETSATLRRKLWKKKSALFVMAKARHRVALITAMMMRNTLQIVPYAVAIVGINLPALSVMGLGLVTRFKL
jgi:hypothetical protein